MKKRDFMRLFVKERDAALLSMDRDRIVAYCEKHGVPAPEDEEVFWRGVHKAICNIKSAPQDKVEASRKWLAEHGSTPEIRL